LLLTSGSLPEGKSFALNLARFSPALIPNDGEKVEVFWANKAIVVPNTNASKLIFFIYENLVGL
jgi:hypothetical protein